MVICHVVSSRSMSFSLSKYISIIPKLGFRSIFLVALYRFLLRLGIYKIITPKSEFNKSLLIGDLFNAVNLSDVELYFSKTAQANLLERADKLLEGKINLFFNKSLGLVDIRDWDVDGFENKKDFHWSNIEINGFDGNDIKNLWDPSRFRWLIDLSLAFKVSGNVKYLETAEELFKDWVVKNGINKGCNWLCAQECSIRGIHAILGSLILGERDNAGSLIISFVISHFKRVRATLSYSKAQNNNHAIVELGFLYIAALWLSTQNNCSVADKRNFKRRYKKYKKFLQKRVNDLVLKDGGFCMYSLNYHRVFVDFMALIEYSQSRLSEKFSDHTYSIINSSILWLSDMVDPLSGDAPNLGANDGSLYSFNYADFRDHMSSVVFASQMFHCPVNSYFENGLDFIVLPFKPKKELFTSSKHTLPPTICNYKSSGIVKFHNDLFWGIIKYPSYEFRPSQADLAHIDIWYKGENILRDSGTYRYNCDKKCYSYFSGIEGHNSLKIDYVEPMRRLGQFLYLDWPKAEVCIDNDAVGITYATHNAVRHTRTLNVSNRSITIKDEVKNVSKNVEMFLHLSDDDWMLNNNVLSNGRLEMHFSSNASFTASIIDGYESRYYGSKNKVPVLSLTLNQKKLVKIETTIREVEKK